MTIYTRRNILVIQSYHIMCLTIYVYIQTDIEYILNEKTIVIDSRRVGIVDLQTGRQPAGRP